MTNIGLIDADLIDSHTNFPNLALMKISGYYKYLGHDVELTTWDKSAQYDEVFVSKVFDYTSHDNAVLARPNVTYGGSGFSWTGPDLSPKIEHAVPDYSLYSAVNLKSKEYHKSAIGFTTRGCFRHCDFCINKKYDKVVRWSPVEEFYTGQKYIVLCDDNVLGSPDRENILDDIISYGRPYKFKQGLDIRLMTPRIADTLLTNKYMGPYTFAFDDWDQRDQIVPKFDMFDSGRNKENVTVYILAGFKSTGSEDIHTVFERIRVCMQYNYVPYLMRYGSWNESEMRGMYINIGRWVNQPSILKKMSFRDFVESHPEHYAARRYSSEFESRYPEIAAEFYDIRYDCGGM